MHIADINAEARALVDADTTSLTDATLLRRVNAAYEEVIGKLLALDTNWSFGDSNYTSLPTGLSNLTAGTQAYQLTSGWLNIHSVQILDDDGNWKELKPRLLKDLEPITEYQETDGEPAEYALREDFLLLFPAPAAADVTTTNGLKLIVDRTASVYTSGEVTTGTKVPGFASPWHVLLAYKMALPYAQSYKPKRVPFLVNEINRLERGLINHYSKTNKDTLVRKKLSPALIIHR
jgi:hypothetical protein|tara:strand:+ start:1519 stop:2220 length:702 start_codon:yes stop_codon:yes gene_type:complete